ncbi:hypothetical protein, partial [Bradyrhizobium japonicum]|uniref:hypothetical protein n=1 Tax=Bradyrhizobium japonicum TaxID=375 RepID=UPI001AEC1CBB
DMHSVPRRKRIKRLARERNAMKMAAHGPAIGPHLIELRFQKVRQQNRRERRQQHMIARPSLCW